MILHNFLTFPFPHRDALTCQLEKELFTGSSRTATGSPVLCVQDYLDHCANLTALIGSLEDQLKLLVKDYDSKKKVSTMLACSLFLTMCLLGCSFVVCFI